MSTRTRIGIRAAAATAAASAAIALGAVALAPQPASAFTVPGPPLNCTATEQNGDVLVKWAAPASNGGDAIFRYVVKIEGQADPVVKIENGAARSYLWTTPYVGTSKFQVRAVNSAGFGAWCTTPIGSAPPPSPTPTPSPTPSPSPTPPPSSTPPTTTATPTPTPTPTATGRPYIPYSAGAWMKQTLAQLGVTQNATKTTAMRSYINANDPHNAPNIQGLGTGWGSTWGGVVGCSDAVYKIGTGTVQPENAFLKTTGFHATAQMAADLNAAAATGATDLPFEVVDRCGNSTFPTGFTVKGGHADVVAGTGTAANPYVLNVLSAGAYGNDTNGLDGRVPGSNGPNNWSSRGVIAASATIRADQVRYGIDQATDLGQRLELFWWETDSSLGKISPPMAGFEGSKFGWGAEGQLVGVSPSFVPAASCTAGEKVIVRTLQTYGAYIGDNAGAGGSSLKGEQNHGQWAGLGLSQQGLANDCGLTWNDFVAY